MMSAEPLTGSAVAVDVSVIVEPLGASSGTFSQATVRYAAPSKQGNQGEDARRSRDIMKTITILIPMDLAGQAERGRARRERGYAMAALLVGHEHHGDHDDGRDARLEADGAAREGRGADLPRQAVRARDRPVPAQVRRTRSPPSLDVLVEQRFLRKKFKDPITNDDFVPILAGQTAPGTAQQQPAAAARPVRRLPAAAEADADAGNGATGRRQAGGPPVSAGPGQTTGGISGVASKSKDQSIRLYNGRGHYNEWAFVYIQTQQAPGAGGAPGATTPGGRGQPPGLRPRRTARQSAGAACRPTDPAAGPVDRAPVAGPAVSVRSAAAA